MRLVPLLLLALAAAAGDEPEEWFSHKRHAAFELACTHCHASAERAARAGMPAAGRCLECHRSLPETTPALRRLRKLSPAARPFAPQYDNLPDYVIFSHARHARAKAGCAVCHGDVAAQDQTGPANALNMKACVDCHRERGASTACRLCHRVTADGGRL